MLDHVGPLARSVGDAWTVYRALLGAEPKPIGAVPPNGLRLGVLRSYFCDLLDDGVRTCFENALDRLARAGTRIAEIDIPHARDIAPVYLTLVLADAAAYHGATLEQVPDQYTPGVRLRLEMGRYILGEDYVRALTGRALLKREVDAALASCDALVLPALPIPAPPIGAVSLKIGGVEESVRNLMLRETQLFNLTGHPAVAMPCGRASEGLPCSLQLVGARMHTEELVRVALTCEREIDGLNR
jgi:aspartyl-tRNA(Asn)/glutamyl-tRNA(Gln) amidotransferase subunit A